MRGPLHPPTPQTPCPGFREVWFDENADRLGRKLEEMSTIARVHVALEQYPSSDSGGWGGTAVNDGTEGGYVWKVRLTIYLVWKYY